jgi:hypothetical protein
VPLQDDQLKLSVSGRTLEVVAGSDGRDDRAQVARDGTGAWNSNTSVAVGSAGERRPADPSSSATILSASRTRPSTSAVVVPRPWSGCVFERVTAAWVNVRC